MTGFPTGDGRRFRPWALGLGAALLAAAVAAFVVFVTFDGDVTAMFRIGSDFAQASPLGERPVHAFEGEVGYDGQQFLALALDPFLLRPGTLRLLDNPSYRARRILYPLLGRLLGAGNPRLIPWVLVGLNVASLGLLVLVMGLHLERAGVHAVRSLFILCVLGAWAVLLLSTSDLLCSLFVFSALFFQSGRRPALAAAALAMAALTREAALLLWAAFLASAALRRAWREAGHLAWAAIPAAAWNVWVLSFVPSGGVAGERQDFGPPFAGIAQAFLTISREGVNLKGAFEFCSLALLVACFGLLLARAVRSWRSNPTAHLCGLVYFGLFVFAGRACWATTWTSAVSSWTRGSCSSSAWRRGAARCRAHCSRSRASVRRLSWPPTRQG